MKQVSRGSGRRLLVCGDRNWQDKEYIRAFIKRINPDVIIEGEARGADTFARQIAEEMDIKVMSFPADWERYGRSAGPIRNKRMLDEGKPDLVLAFHADIEHSKGTADMIRQARARGIQTDLFTGSILR